MQKTHGVGAHGACVPIKMRNVKRSSAAPPPLHEHGQGGRVARTGRNNVVRLPFGCSEIHPQRGRKENRPASLWRRVRVCTQTHIRPSAGSPDTLSASTPHSPSLLTYDARGGIQTSDTYPPCPGRHASNLVGRDLLARQPSVEHRTAYQ